jgi:hypothetical protein
MTKPINGLERYEAMTEEQMKVFVTELTQTLTTVDELYGDLRDNLEYIAEMLTNFVSDFNK